MDATACNYDASATCDDGFCILPDGCTDATACNYDASATCDDGSCILPDGCTDSTACNYDASATCDDGSCAYVSAGSGTVIACDSYTWDGVAYTVSGVYTNTYTNTAGCDSLHNLNLTINYSNTASSSISICAGDSVVVGTSVYTTTGNYTDILTNVGGCDSTVITELIVMDAPSLPLITQLFSTTLTTDTFDSYQWYRDGVLIVGETNQTLNLSQAGIYSVVVFNANGCSTESDGFAFGVTGIDEVLLKEFNIYPNPTTDLLYLSTPEKLGSDYIIMIYDFMGRKVMELDNNKLRLDEPVLNISYLNPANYKLVIKYASGDIWTRTINKQ